MPLPVECETEASPEEPLLLLAISVEPAMLGELMLESRIARVLRHVHAEYAKPLSVEELARKAGMSVAAFHHDYPGREEGHLQARSASE